MIALWSGGRRVVVVGSVAALVVRRVVRIGPAARVGQVDIAVSALVIVVGAVGVVVASSRQRVRTGSSRAAMGRIRAWASVAYRGEVDSTMRGDRGSDTCLRYQTLTSAASRIPITPSQGLRDIRVVQSEAEYVVVVSRHVA